MTSSVPRKSVTGPCRLCGTTTILTKEHIPPKSSGNKLTQFEHSFDDWLRSPGVELESGRHQQGGIFGFTLCHSCNSLTGHRYGTPYRQWASLATKTLGSLLPPAQLDALTKPLGWNFTISEADGAFQPGAVVRQVLSCMCSLSGTWNLAGVHQELRRIILEGATEPLPASLDLAFALYFGPRSRMAGPQLRVDVVRKSWAWVMELAYPPFAFLLNISKSSEADSVAGLNMSDWVQYQGDERKTFEGYVELGFGWSPYPGDLRSRGRIDAER